MKFLLLTVFHQYTIDALKIFNMIIKFQCSNSNEVIKNNTHEMAVGPHCYQPGIKPTLEGTEKEDQLESK